MATSSTFDTSNQFVKYNITVNVNSQDIVKNTSNITVSVRFWRTNSYETWGTGTVFCGINGTNYSQAVSPSQRITNNGIDLFSRTVDISHNSDGAKTIWCSAYIRHNAPLNSNDQGFNVNLPRINRKSTITEIGNFNVEGEHWLTYKKEFDSAYMDLFLWAWKDGEKENTGMWIGESWGGYRGNYGSGEHTNFNSKQRADIYKLAMPQTTVGTKVNFRYILKTYIGSGGSYIGEDSRVVQGTIQGNMKIRNGGTWKNCVPLDEKGLKYEISASRDFLKKNNFFSYPAMEICGKPFNFLDSINWLKSHNMEGDE